MTQAWQRLESALLAAHQAGNEYELSCLYARAALMLYQSGDVDRACFYDTHAYVYGLCSDHPGTSVILSRLQQAGREV